MIKRVTFKLTHSYSQKPNVETRFQLTTEPQVCRTFLIIASGTLSLILPTNTVIIGPSCIGICGIFGGFVLYICGRELIVGPCDRLYGGRGGGVDIDGRLLPPII